jgi:hypothetical protein
MRHRATSGGAQHCRLSKDVDGLYERDPALVIRQAALDRVVDVLARALRLAEDLREWMPGLQDGAGRSSC